MSSKSVLLTGATGSLGANVLEKLLEQGFSVLAVLRSAAKSEAFIAKKYADAVSAGKLTFCEIPDMTVAGSFDGPASKVSAIVHVATPIGYSDFVNTVISPAMKVTENVLLAAAKFPTAKRVVWTGSIVSVMRLPQDVMSGRTFSAADFNPIPLSEATENAINAYQYSKVTTEQFAWSFMEKTKPGFDLVVVLAPSITGRSFQEGYEPSKTALGGQASVYRAVFDVETPGFMLPYFMDADDVAAVHVTSLNAAKIPGNKRYLFSTGKINSNDLANKIRAEMPHLRSRVPEGATTSSSGGEDKLAKIDVRDTDEVFGTEWVGWWDSAKLTVRDILDFEGKKGKGGKSGE